MPQTEPTFSQRAAMACAELGINLEDIARRHLSLWPEPAELVTVANSPAGLPLQLAPSAANAWLDLQEAAQAGGVDMYLVSAWRSIERQVAIFRRKLAQGVSLDTILAVNAPPGYSEHHSGRAIDIGTPGCPDLEEDFENTAAFRWLNDHAADYGFSLSFPRDNRYGYLYEPWHWRFADAK